MMTPAETAAQIAALAACITGRPVHVDAADHGPEPRHITDWEADRIADSEWARYERQWGAA